MKINAPAGRIIGPRGAATMDIPEYPRTFQRHGARINFQRIQVIPDRVELPTGEVITIWRINTNELDVLVETGVQSTGWSPIPDVVPERGLVA